MKQQIVTLQFGEYSNHVGTHLWNAQDVYNSTGQDASIIDSQVTFRQGKTAWVRSISLPNSLTHPVSLI